MCSRRLTLAAATAAWLAATTLVAAEPVTADMPTGDVWVTQQGVRPVPAQAARNAPGRRLLPTGDFWPADEDATRTADAPAPPREALAREEAAAAGK